MTAVSRATLQAEANVVKNETASEANTAARVGGVLRDLADSTMFPGDPAVDTGSASERGFVAYQVSSDILGARFVAKKSRGSVGSPSDLAVGDAIAEFVARPYLSSAFVDAAVFGAYKFTSGSARARYALSLHDGVSLQPVMNMVAVRGATADATATTALTLTMGHADSIISLTVRWRGIDTAHNMVFRESSFVFRRINTAGPTQWGSTLDTFATLKDDAGCGTPGFAVSGNDILLQVTGKAATSYVWDIQATWREMF
jgi:hypothetical protein